MYRKIRIAMVSLMTMAMCVLSSTATLSYFTDTDGTINNFTVGNASTILAIYNNELGDDEHAFNAGDYTLTDNLDIPFYLRAKNEGNIPVYQRFRIVIPIDLAGIITLNLPGMDDDCVIATTFESESEKEIGSTCSNENYTVTYKPSVSVEDTPTYAEYYITSKNILPVGQSTAEWPTLGIHVEDFPDDYDTSSLSCENNNSCVLGIHAYSDAIQTTGFTDALTAFEGATETYNN